MRLLDSNVLIYAARNEYAFLRTLIVDVDSGASILSKLESLGYLHLTSEDKRCLEGVFATIKIYPIDDDAIINQAILLRQTKKISTGDSIIAATALLNDLELHTNNTDDFIHILNLIPINPLSV